MEHEEIRLRLAAYLDNAVSEEEKREVKRHLGMCGRCREEIADLELTVRYLKSIPEVEPPSWLSDKIMSEVLNESKKERSFWRSLFFPLYLKLPLEAFAIIAICLTGYFLTSKVSEQPPDDTGLRVSPKLTSKENRPAEILTDTRNVPVQSGQRSDLPRRKKEYPSSTEVPTPEPLPSAARLQKEPVAPSSSTPPVRHAVEPELQPLDDGFMSNRETTFQGKEENASVALKSGKKALAGEGLPATAAQSYRKEEIVIVVDDPAAATEKIEALVNRFGGRIKGHSYSGETHLLVFQIGTDKATKFLDRLGQIGRLQERSPLHKASGGLLEITLKW